MNRPNLWIKGIQEEETLVNGTGNIFNKIIEENFPNLKKMSIRYKKHTEDHVDWTRKEIPHGT